MEVNLSDHYFSIQIRPSSSSCTFHHVWLRDSCECSSCTHPSSLQKLRSSATIPLDVKPTTFLVDEDNLRVEWNDGHHSSFSSAWLSAHAYHAGSAAERREEIKPSLWTINDLNQSHTVAFDDFMHDDKALKSALRTFLDYGILFIAGVPKEHDSVEKVATRIGPIRETFFGRSWDVINIPNAHNIAYTAVDLGLHQDLPYFESVPPVQMLHCMQQASTGGESVFVDSYLAAERLRKQYPEHFETLLRVPMTFQYTNNGHNFVCQKPILYRNHNLYIGVNFSPQNHGPLRVPPEDVCPFYAAFQQFSKLVYSEDLVLHKKLAEGELAIFDNRRVLHGRASFNPSEPRHLRGLYIGMDEVEDRYSEINKKEAEASKHNAPRGGT